MNYYLPETLEVNGNEYKIRSDYRVVLDIFTALNDPDLSSQEKAFVAMAILYEDVDEIPIDDFSEALRQCFWFINGGKYESEDGKSRPKLVDWEKDFEYIIAPINKIVGRDVRGMEMHWWTFLSCYMEIDNKCTFATIVSIRSKIHKKGVSSLDDAEKAFYRENKDMVDIPIKLTQEEEDLFKQWGV